MMGIPTASTYKVCLGGTGLVLELDVFQFCQQFVPLYGRYQMEQGDNVHYSIENIRHSTNTMYRPSACLVGAYENSQNDRPIDIRFSQDNIFFCLNFRIFTLHYFKYITTTFN